jgi:hypothetical protein
MSQYERLFATCRVPTDLGCRMESYDESRHIVVLRRGQFCECILPESWRCTCTSLFLFVVW